MIPVPRRFVARLWRGISIAAALAGSALLLTGGGQPLSSSTVASAPLNLDRLPGR